MTYELMKDEAEFRNYIESVIGEEDSNLLADLAWTASESVETGYLTTLAQIARTIAEHGPTAVANTIAAAKKPNGENVVQYTLAKYAKELTAQAVESIQKATPETIEKVTERAWRTLLRKMKKKLIKLYPNASDATVEKALAIACIWDRENETFGIEPMKLVDAMRAPS